jgi:hypothetical protein
MPDPNIKLTDATEPATDNRVEPEAPPVAAPDPFDLDSLRLDPNFEKTAGVRKVISVVPVRKPGPQEWIRVHPDPAYRINCSCIKMHEEGEFFLVTPQIAFNFENEVMPVTIYTTVNMSGTVCLWPVRITSPDGRQSTWASSAHEAALVGMKQRIRVKANRSLGGYEFHVSDNLTPEQEPVWPNLSLAELVQLAFAKPGKLVSSAEHPIMRLLLGRA